MNQGSQRQLFANGDNATVECSRVFPHPITPANKSLRGSRGPEAGVRGIPSPFIKIYERGRDTPHPSLRPLLPRKDSSAGLVGYDFDNNRRRHMKRAKFGEVIRIVARRSAQRLVGAALALLLFTHNGAADSSLLPYGMSTRVAPAPYLRMPHLAGGKIPPLLSQTGAFSDTRRLVPAPGL